MKRLRSLSLCLYLSVVAQFNVTNVTWRGSLCQENDGMLSVQCVSEGLCTELSRWGDLLQSQQISWFAVFYEDSQKADFCQLMQTSWKAVVL